MAKKVARRGGFPWYEKAFMLAVAVGFVVVALVVVYVLSLAIQVVR